MALTQCPACGNDVSTQAVTCPKCGHPLQATPAPAASPAAASENPKDWRQLDRWLAKQPLLVRVLVRVAILVFLYFAIMFAYNVTVNN